MKRIIFLGDGMGDYPIPELGNRTPLQAAKKPNMDRLAREGLLGTATTCPPGLEPGSDVANMAILGYDPSEFYTGRAPLEAAARNIPLGPTDVAYRCNLVWVESGVMKDYSAGHITSQEGAELMRAVQEELGGDGFDFLPGVSYRNLLIRRDGVESQCTPPHNISDKPFEPHLPRDPVLRKFMLDSRAVLADHPVNRKRREAGKPPATMIWFWGCGKAPKVRPFEEKFGARGAIITAVDLLRGVGRYLKFEVIEVPGATGYYDTNYEGKARAALDALRRVDLLYLHVESTDEAGHEGSLKNKLRALEDFDRRCVGPVLDGLPELGEPVRALLTTDHYTPVALKRHTPEPVPFALWPAPRGKGDGPDFSEASAANGSLGHRKATGLMDLLLKP
ncbi:MAG: cofactor-independent phosphoglycerate mutase [Halobacteria archaeon]